MGRRRRRAIRPAPTAAPPPAVRPLPHWTVAALWMLAGLLCFWSFGYATVTGGDLFWHLAAGRYMIEHGTFFGLTDPWSYTFQGKPWLHHEWLSDVVFHAWASIFGRDALVYWKWGVIVTTYLLLMTTLLRLTASPAAGFLAALAACALGSPFLDVRPHLYSILGFAIVLGLSLPRERPSWALPGVFLVWANLHGSFFFGLMALGVACVPYVMRGGEPALKRAAMLFGACLLASAATPNGIEGFYYPIKYAFDSSSPFRTIVEWHPPFQPGGTRTPLYEYALGVFAVSSLVVLARPGLRRDTRVSVIGIGLGLLTLAMSLRSRRFIPLFGMSQALVLAPILGEIFTRLRQRALALPAPRLQPYLPAVLAIGLGVHWLRPYPVSPYAFHYLVDEDFFPIETMNFVEANQLSGKVFALYQWGGYIHFRTDGRLKVYIDGRADTIYDATTYNEYVSVVQGLPGRQEIIERSGAEFVLWQKRRGTLPADLVASGRWRLLYEDAVSQLLVRQDVPLPEPLAETPASGWRELALADKALLSGNLALGKVHLEKSLELMPYLAAACSTLWRVQVAEGEADAARATMARCQRLFPRPHLQDSARGQGRQPG